MERRIVFGRPLQVAGDVDDRSRPDRGTFLIEPFNQLAVFFVGDKEIVRAGADAVEHIDDPFAARSSAFDFGAELREGFVIAIEMSQAGEYGLGGIDG